MLAHDSCSRMRDGFRVGHDEKYQTETRRPERVRKQGSGDKRGPPCPPVAIQIAVPETDSESHADVSAGDGLVGRLLPIAFVFTSWFSNSSGFSSGQYPRQANRAQALGVVSHKLRHGTRPMHRMSIDDQVDFGGRLLKQALHEFDEHRVLELPLKDLFVEK